MSDSYKKKLFIEAAVMKGLCILVLILGLHEIRVYDKTSRLIGYTWRNT